MEMPVKTTEPRSRTAQSPETLLILAESKLRQRDYMRAEHFLQRLIDTCPDDWQAQYKSPNGNIEYAFWDVQEFEAYLPYFHKHELGKEVDWVGPSYSRAYYHFSNIFLEQKQYKQALAYVNEGLILEPDHPELLCHKALILRCMDQLRDAYDLYIHALHVRPWTPAGVKARAMRGAGVLLSEFGKLEAAANMLKSSLELDPGNPTAMNELSHIFLKCKTQRTHTKHNAGPAKAWWKFW